MTVNYGNVSPETMESTVTRPIENAVSRVSGIDYLQSNSFQGQTTVRATFKYGTDINVAATDIQQQVARAATSLPNDPNLQQPQIQKADPNALPVVRLSDHRLQPAAARPVRPLQQPARRRVRRRLGRRLGQRLRRRAARDHGRARR